MNAPTPTEYSEVDYSQLESMRADGCYDFTSSTPAPDAVYNDWRFLPYTMKIHQTDEPVHSSWNVDDVKGKGRKAKFDQILFVFCVPGLIPEEVSA